MGMIDSRCRMYQLHRLDTWCSPLRITILSDSQRTSYFLLCHQSRSILHKVHTWSHRKHFEIHLVSKEGSLLGRNPVGNLRDHKLCTLTRWSCRCTVQLHSSCKSFHRLSSSLEIFQQDKRCKLCFLLLLVLQIQMDMLGTGWQAGLPLMPFQTYSCRNRRAWCCPTDHACPVEKL